MWSVLRRQTWIVAPCVIAAVVLMLAAPRAGAEADLAVSATWDPHCEPCVAGQRLTMVNTVTNQGPDPDPDVWVGMATPALGTTPVEGSPTTTQGAYDTDHAGNIWSVDDSGLAHFLSATLGEMAPGSTATLTYQVDLDMEPPPVSDLTVNSPPDLAGRWQHRGADFGPPFYEWDVTGNLEWVDDGSARPTEGCVRLRGFTPGNIALIDRGSCEFDLKAENAEQAGAIAVVIVNNDPTQPLSELSLGSGNLLWITVPVLVIHYDDGAVLRERILTLGVTVNASVQSVPSVGPGEPWVVTSEGTGYGYLGYGYPSLLAFGHSDPDCCHPHEAQFPACCDPATSDNVLYLQVDVVPAEPSAGFVYEPASPAVNETVTFTNTSTGVAPLTFQWDFGDGATSTDESPTHAYGAAGTSTVTLTATNAVGTDSEVRDITVVPQGQLPERYLVAAAANAAGAAGSFFVTDLEVNNPGEASLRYRFLWLPRDTDNSSPTASAPYTLAAGAGARYENVLEEVFGLSDAVGALAVEADGADAIIMSRTFNRTDAGTFGQAVEGLHASELIQAGERRRVVFLSEDDGGDPPAAGYRSNLGLLNGTGAPLTVMVALHDAAGAPLGDVVTVELRPFESTQLNRVLRGFAPPVEGYADLWTETPGGAFTAYGSVLDNVTSDPTTVPPR